MPYSFFMVAKSIHIAIVLLLIAATTGVTVSQHVCGDRYRYAKLAVDNAHDQCCGDGTMQMSCCHNEITSTQLTDEFNAVTQSPVFETALLAVLPDMNASVEPVAPSIPSEFTVLSRDCTSLHGRGVSVPVLNQSFLI